jgi:hypothetical protein
MSSVSNPLANIKRHLASVWRSAAYFDHPLEWWCPAPLPDQLYALAASRHVNLFRHRRNGRIASYRIAVPHPRRKPRLVHTVDRVAIQHGGFVRHFDLAVELLTTSPLPLKRALESPDHQLRIRRGRGQRRYENTTYLTKRCGQRQPPRNGRLYGDRPSKITGSPCVRYEFIADRPFIHRQGLASIGDVISRFRSILAEQLGIRDKRGRLHPLPAEMLPAQLTFTQPLPMVEYAVRDRPIPLTAPPRPLLAFSLSTDHHPHRPPIQLPLRPPVHRRP